FNRVSASASSDNKPSVPDEPSRRVVFKFFYELPMCMVCHRMTYVDQILEENFLFVSDRLPEIDRTVKKILETDYKKLVFFGEPPCSLIKLSDEKLTVLLYAIIGEKANKMLTIFQTLEITMDNLAEKFFSQDTLDKKFSRDEFKDMIHYRGKTKFVEMEKNVHSFVETCAIFDESRFS
ncbi:ribosomal RNA small subunit methyltransferase A, partial [Striga asiatica]